MKAKIERVIAHRKLKSLINTVNYYKNAYLPDIAEYTGISQQTHLQRAENDLESYRSSLNYYYEHEKFYLLDIPKHEQANFLIAEIMELYQQAKDFSNNPYICVGNLRKCIEMKNEVLKIYPSLDIYSSRAFALGYKMSV